MRSLLAILILAGTLFGGTKENFVAITKRIQKEPVDLAFNLEIFWSVREKTEKKKGTVLLADNNRFDLALGGTRWICNGTTLWQYSASEKQLIIQKAASMDNSMQPAKLFDHFVGRDFKVIPTKSGEILRWEGKDKEFLKIEVKLSADGKKIGSVLFVDLENNESRYSFTKMIFPKSVDSKRFTFTKPAGTEVFDER